MYHSANRFGVAVSRAALAPLPAHPVRVVLRAIYFDGRSIKATAGSHGDAEAGEESPSRVGDERSGDSHLPNGICAGILAARCGYGNGGSLRVRRNVFPLADLDCSGA